MTWVEFATHDDGPLIAGRRAGSGPPVLLLHGGPGLGFDYLRDLADELAQENDVAWYQHEGARRRRRKGRARWPQMSAMLAVSWTRSAGCLRLASAPHAALRGAYRA